MVDAPLKYVQPNGTIVRVIDDRFDPNAPGGSSWAVDALPKWHKALRDAKAGLRNATIWTAGDSISIGDTTSITARAASLIGGRLGLTVRRGYNPTGTGNTENGSRPATISCSGTGWVNAAGGTFYNWPTLYGTQGSADMIHYAPTDPCDQFVMHVSEGGSAIQTSVDGGAFQTWAVSPSMATVVTVPTGSRGYHTLDIKAGASGGANIVLSVTAEDSTRYGVRWVSSGQSGAPMPVSLPFRNPVAAADLVLVAFGTNDALQGVTLDSFRTKLTAMLTQVQALGTADVLGWGFPPLQTQGSFADESEYRAIIEDVTSSRGIPIVDVGTLWGAWSNIQSLGYELDGVHPSDLGRRIIAKLVADICA